MDNYDTHNKFLLIIITCDTGEKQVYCGRLALYIQAPFGPIETKQYHTC